MLDVQEKYGVKISIISPMDWEDFHEIVSATQSKHYKVTMNDNGTAT